jgi:MFS transporter, SHS family, lactate transporter
MVAIAVPASRAVPWWKEPTKDQWYAYIAAWLGWTLDAFDFTIFLLIMLPISQEFGVPLVAVTAVFTVTLWLRLVGATGAGWLADRMGRRAPLMISIFWYSICNFIAGFSPSFAFLFFFRALLGIGMGAEWPAGAALAMESWPSRSRGFMSGLLQGSWGIGYALSSVCFYGLNGRPNPLFGIVPFAGPTIGWREMLWLGILPALVCVWIRFYVKEPEVWVENKRLLAEHTRSDAPTVSLWRRATKALLTVLAWLPNAAVVGGLLFLALRWALPFVFESSYITMISALTAAYLTVFIMPSFGHLVDAKMPLVFKIFLPGMAWNTFTACLWMASSFCVYYSIWALFPTYLQTLQKEGIVTAWQSWAALFFANIVVVAGSGLWGVYADRWGRRWGIIIPALIAMFLAPIYLMTKDPMWIVLGFIAQGVFGGSIYGQNPSYLSERYPTEVRGVATGLVYHQGAIWGGLVPPVLTFLAIDQNLGFALPMMYSTIGFLLVVILAVFLGPETKGKVLTAEPEVVKLAA